MRRKSALSRGITQVFLCCLCEGAFCLSIPEKTLRNLNLTKGMLSEANENWEPFVQTSLRKDLHGTDLARAIVAAGVRFIESERVPDYADVMLPGTLPIMFRTS
jgi:hypothetical protein